MRFTSFLLSGLLSVGLVSATPVAINDELVVRQESTTEPARPPRPTGPFSFTGTFSFPRPTGSFSFTGVRPTGSFSRRPRPTGSFTRPPFTFTGIPPVPTSAAVEARQIPDSSSHSRRPRPTGSFTGSFSRPTGSFSGVRPTGSRTRRPRPTVAPTVAPVEIEARQYPDSSSHSRRPRPTGSFTGSFSRPTGSFTGVRPTGSRTRRPRPTATPTAAVEIEERDDLASSHAHLSGSRTRPAPTGPKPTGSFTRPVPTGTRTRPVPTGTRTRPIPTGTRTAGPRPTKTASASDDEEEVEEGDE